MISYTTVVFSLFSEYKCTKLPHNPGVHQKTNKQKTVGNSAGNSHIL